MDRSIKRFFARRWGDRSWEALGIGLLASIVGFTGSVAVVMQGLRAAGANDAEVASGLTALTVGMGVSGIILAMQYRMPISVAWSTPGAALLISSGDTVSSINQAIGAYLFSAVLLLLAGWFRPLGRLIESIPTSLANAMLAGVLLSICLAPVKAVAYEAMLAIPLLLTWWLVGQFNRYAAVPAALLLLVILVAWRLGLPDDFASQLRASLLPELVLIVPEFDGQTLISIGIPLFVVTMASQNIPGAAVLQVAGYRPGVGPLIMNTGLFSLVTAPFGAHGINLAAITAAMFCSEEAHADPARRYWAAVFAGMSYVVLGVFAGATVLIITLIPAVLLEAIAGLALLGSFSSAIVAALSDEKYREAAAITFLFSASGLAFAGVGGAFWGLVTGGCMVLLINYRNKNVH
ncbi:MAG: benzoate/H(+) symporter BenE family transporter [Granulosicoccus sp.]|nr:benzoate/H(+) symporter BenE family transporter [Granulosicoccus sp.]